MNSTLLDISTLRENVDSIQIELIPNLKSIIDQIHDLRLNVLKVKAHLKKLRDEKAHKTQKEFLLRKLKIEKNLIHNINEYAVSFSPAKEQTQESGTHQHPHRHHHQHHNHHHHRHHRHNQVDNPSTEEISSVNEHSPINVENIEKSYKEKTKLLSNASSKQTWSLSKLPFDNIHLDHKSELMPLISQHFLLCGISEHDLWDYEKYPLIASTNIYNTTKLAKTIELFQVQKNPSGILEFLDDLIFKYSASKYDENNRFVMPIRDFPFSNPSVFKMYVELVFSNILFYQNNKLAAQEIINKHLPTLTGDQFISELNGNDQLYLEKLKTEYLAFSIRLNNSFDNTMYIKNKSLMETLDVQIQEIIQLFKTLFCYTYDFPSTSLIQKCCYSGIFTLISLSTQFDDRQFLASRKLSIPRNSLGLQNNTNSLESLYQWFHDQDINFEVELPKSLQRFHANFVCPVTRTQVDPIIDPPKSLKCGHILSSRAISQMINFHSIKCPYCSAHSPEYELQSLQFHYL